MKTLYNLHIPKCGGKGFQNLITILEKNGLSTFNVKSKDFDGYDKYAYVQTHYGSDPMDKYPEIDTACLFRDPLERLISQFAWANMEGIYKQDFEDYAEENIHKLLKYFLFEDEKFVNNNNLQAKFLCNAIDQGIFYIKHISPLMPDGSAVQTENPFFYGIHWQEWLISNSKTSLEYAKQQIDKMIIVDTLENYDRFVSNVCNWFKDNYQLDIEQEFRYSLVTENPTFNYSIFTDSKGNEWTTAKLKALLTPEEIAKVYENNSIDLEIYNYVKGK